MARLPYPCPQTEAPASASTKQLNGMSNEAKELFVSGVQGSSPWEVLALMLGVATLGALPASRWAVPLELSAVCWSMCALCTFAADGQ